MLTLKQILNVGRMIEQTRGYPPGAYDMYAQSRKTPFYHSPLHNPKSSVENQKNFVLLSLDYVIDELERDVRIVQRE